MTAWTKNDGSSFARLPFQLLEKDPAERLGVSDSLHGDITQQNFFKSIDFVKLEKKELRPPYTPDLVIFPLSVRWKSSCFSSHIRRVLCAITLRLLDRPTVRVIRLQITKIFSFFASGCNMRLLFCKHWKDEKFEKHKKKHIFQQRAVDP
jgi:hypothetical protein